MRPRGGIGHHDQKCKETRRTSREDMEISIWLYPKTSVADDRVGYGNLELLAETDFLDDSEVTIGARILEIIEQAPPLAHQHQQTTTAGMVLGMPLKMPRQLRDPVR